MIELLIQHHESDRKITVRANESLSIHSLIDTVVEKLGLRSYEPVTLRYFTYSLKVIDQEGKAKELSKDKSLGDQLKNGDNLILEGSSSHNPISNSEFGLATLSVGSSWSVKEIEQLLHNLDTAYSAVFASNEILLDSKRSDHGYYYEDKAITRRHERIVSNMGAHEQLRINRININSPGLVEIIGDLNPLETIRQFLKDHREAKQTNEKIQDEKEKEKNYRNAIEQAKASLEIETLKNKVAKERMALLRDAGFSQEELRPYVKDFLEKPLDELLIYQEQKKVEITAVVSLGVQQIEFVKDSQNQNNEDGNNGRYLMPPSS